MRSRAFDLSRGRARPRRRRAAASRAGSAVEAVARRRGGDHHAPRRQPCPRRLRKRVIGKAPTGAILIDCSTIDVATAREEIEKAEAAGYADGRRPRLGRHRRGRGRQPHLHGRRQRRSLRPRPPFARDHGQGGDPRRRPGLGPGRQDLQQHAARRLDGRHLRDLRHGQEARPRSADLLRHLLQGVGPVLVDDHLLPGPRRRPGDARRPRL